MTGHAGGATVWKNPHIQFVDATGKPVGGKQAELDFLILGAGAVQEIVSAKMGTDQVRPGKDRSNLSKYYLPSLSPLDLTAMGATFGSPSAYRNATEARIVYEDASGAQHSMTVSAFRAAFPASTTAPGVRGLVPQPAPGDSVHPGTLTLDLSRADLVDIAIIEIKKRL